MKRILSIVLTVCMLATLTIIPSAAHAYETSDFVSFSTSPVSSKLEYKESPTLKISDTYSNNGLTYYYVGKIQQITLKEKSNIDLNISVISTTGNAYNQGSVYFGIFSEPNANHESIIQKCYGSTVPNSPRMGKCSVELNAGTYYIAVYSAYYEKLAHLTNVVYVSASYTPSSTYIDKAKLASIPNKAYTGKAIVPSLNLTYNGKTLVKGTDYTVKYYDNIKTGEAIGIITGKNKFYGNKFFKFKIVPQRSILVSVLSLKKKTVKVTWKKQSQVTGYQIVISQNSRFTKGNKYSYAGSSATTKTFIKLTSKKVYYVKVRAYKTINGKKAYGAFSSYKKIRVK